MTAASDWTGSVGDIWAAEWRRTDRSFADLSRHLDAAILAAAPDGPFRALDIGCGAGCTSLALAEARPDATILGVDLSEGLVEVARNRLAIAPPVLPRRREPRAASDNLRNSGLPLARERGLVWRGESSDDREAAAGEVGTNHRILRPSPEYAVAEGGVRFETGDAITAVNASAPFDLLYSRHGVMFFDDPVAAFTALRDATAPGARLVFSCFADWSENAFAKAIADALDLSPPTPRASGPFAFADERYVADILTKSGWTQQRATQTPFTYRAGEEEGEAAIADARSFFQRIGPAAGPLRAASSVDRPAMLDRLTAIIQEHRVGNAIDFPALAWIWSATA